MTLRSCFRLSALILALGLPLGWLSSAPAPFSRYQEATALLDVRDRAQARKILSRLKAFQSDEERPGCQLTYGKVDSGRAVLVRLRTDGTVDAERRLSVLVEQCLRDVFPDRARAESIYRTLTEAGPQPGQEKGGLYAKRARMTEEMRQEFAADLRRQEAAVIIQPPLKVRR